MPTLTREQLYALVWSEPIQKLAPRYGLSDRGFGKLCARYDIPVPPRGYWAKKVAGKKVFQPKLPPSKYPAEQKIKLANSPTSVAQDEASQEDHPLIAFERQGENRISVPEQLELTSPLVLRTRTLLNKARRDSDGMIIVPTGALHIHTSRALHERALRVVQTLITAFEKRGFKVEMSSAGGRVTILEEPLGFGIEEGIKNVEHRTSFTEQKQIERGYGYQIPKWDSMPSGELRLVITNVHAMRQRWSEGPQKPLEGMLNKFMIGLVRAALRVKVQRAEAERLERERQEEERQVQEEARRLAEVELRWREEEARVERLVRLQAMWRRNRGLREIVLALKAAVGDIDAESGLGKWLAWVEKYAELSDPLNRFRNRRLEPLTVYYYGWNSERVAQEGFEEPELTGYSKEREKPGIEVTERPPRRSAYERALKLEIPEDVLLAYEWPQESDDYWRVFRVPAAVLNRALRHSSSGDEAIVPPEQG